MSTFDRRYPFVNLAAAFVLAGGLIAAATIDSHRPVVVPAGTRAATSIAPAQVTPPIPQDAARDKVRSQILNALAIHNFTYKGVTHILSNVTIDRIIYSPKDDAFGYAYTYIWTPAMPDTGPTGGSEDLKNDGYGHYYGTVRLNNPNGPDPVAPITIP